jgi:hypothetical protein
MTRILQLIIKLLSKIDNQRNIIKSNNIEKFHVHCDSRDPDKKRIRVRI